jgi:hypothetical protein
MNIKMSNLFSVISDLVSCQGCFYEWFDLSGKQGLSSHSTVLSGLLAFIITYASPFLFLIGMMLLSSPPPTNTNLNQTSRDFSLSEARLLEILVVPCILPVALNGVILVAFTAVLTLMQDHLFVWSVFSPKYELLLYTISFNTICLFEFIRGLCKVQLSFSKLIGDCWGFAGIYTFVQQQPAQVLVHSCMQ